MISYDDLPVGTFDKILEKVDIEKLKCKKFENLPKTRKNRKNHKFKNFF